MSDRIGSRSLVVTGMGLMAVGLGWFAFVSSPTVAYSSQVPGLVVCGVGMSLYFAPIANLVPSTVKRKEEGKASGVNNAVREVSGVFGIAVRAGVSALLIPARRAAGSEPTPAASAPEALLVAEPLPQE